MSDSETLTPRTDEMENKCEVKYEEFDEQRFIDFARQLERELNAAKAENSALKAEVERLKDAVETEIKDANHDRKTFWEVEVARLNTELAAIRKVAAAARECVECAPHSLRSEVFRGDKLIAAISALDEAKKGENG